MLHSPPSASSSSSRIYLPQATTLISPPLTASRPLGTSPGIGMAHQFSTSSATPTPVDLRNILTPTLFHSIVRNRVPWNRYEVLSYHTVGHYFFLGQPNTTKEFNALCYPALKALSQLGAYNIPDNLLQFLPPPSSPEFPEQALGFQLLLNQGNRSVCQGIDERYVLGCFDPLSNKLIRQLLTLPPDLQPWNKIRWTVELRTSTDWWLVVSFWFLAPLVHSEALRDQETAETMIEDLRQQVERLSGRRDPNRDRKREILSDTTAFARMCHEGPPPGPYVRMDEFWFWAYTLMDVHKPIIAWFGRYPYRNAGAGRVSTAEEKQWLDRTGHFGEVDQESARRIREDVVMGRWTSLGGK